MNHKSRTKPASNFGSKFHSSSCCVGSIKTGRSNLALAFKEIGLESHNCYPSRMQALYKVSKSFNISSLMVYSFLGRHTGILWSAVFINTGLFFLVRLLLFLMGLKSSHPYQSKLFVDRSHICGSKQERKGICGWKNAGNALRGDEGRCAGRRRERSKSWREGDNDAWSGEILPGKTATCGNIRENRIKDFNPG